MNNECLIQPAELFDRIAAGSGNSAGGNSAGGNSAGCIIADCRFDLSRPDQGRQSWLSGHVPGARYLHLDHDLASPVTADSGRHPLPRADDFAATLASIGWSPDKLLVAYDGSSNGIAARMWWLMRYFGQSSVLLDGGFAAWEAAGLPVEAGEVKVTPAATVVLRGNQDMITDADEILGALGTSAVAVVDARAAERFAGEFEPLDTRGGHIPGAFNRPLNLNNEADGTFKAPDALRREFSLALGDVEPGSVVHSCGSGVTACHNHFAMTLAGLNPGRVYPGSWSEWIRDPERPVEMGPCGHVQVTRG